MAPAPPSPSDLAFPPLPNTSLHPPGHPNVENGPALPRDAPGGPLLATTSTAGAWNGVARSLAVVTKPKAACRFPVINLAARQYGTKDGKPSVSFTTAELKVGEENLKHTLVAKFSDGRPHIEEVRTSLSAAWALSGQCSIGAWDAKHVLIVLDSETDARKVLAHPMRKLGHALFRIFRWSKDFSTKREPTTTSTWIRLPHLPPELYNPGYIHSVVSAFGTFLAVDNRTMAFSNPNYARVCMEVDTTKDMPDEVWISTGIESGFWQKIIFENRLLYCSKCRLHGHTISNCRKVKLHQEHEQRIWAARDDYGLPTDKPKGAAPQEKQSYVKSLSTAKERQSFLSASDKQGWKVVNRRKGKQNNKSTLLGDQLAVPQLVKQVNAVIEEEIICNGTPGQTLTNNLHQNMSDGVQGAEDNPTLTSNELDDEDVNVAADLLTGPVTHIQPISPKTKIQQNSLDAPEDSITHLDANVPALMDVPDEAQGEVKVVIQGDAAIAEDSSPTLVGFLAAKDKDWKLVQRKRTKSKKQTASKDNVLNVHADSYVPMPRNPPSSNTTLQLSVESAHKGQTSLVPPPALKGNAMAILSPSSVEVNTLKGHSNVSNNASSQKMDLFKANYNSLSPNLILSMEDRTRIIASCNRKAHMYSRGSISEEDDDHYRRRSNPYID